MPDEFKPDDDPADIDAELAKALGPTDPDTLIEFGQTVGRQDKLKGTPDVLPAIEALGTLHQSAPDLSYVWPRERPFTGPVIALDSAEMAELQRDHVPEKPTHRNTPRIPDLNPGFWWFPLGQYQDHPLRDSFRNLMGRRLTTLLPVRELEIATFVSAINQACKMTPDWVEVLVFSSEPQEGPLWSTTDPPDLRDYKRGDQKRLAERFASTPRKVPLNPVNRIKVPDSHMRMVECAIVATKLDPLGSPQIPDWLRDLPEG